MKRPALLLSLCALAYTPRAWATCTTSGAIPECTADAAGEEVVCDFSSLTNVIADFESTLATGVGRVIELKITASPGYAGHCVTLPFDNTAASHQLVIQGGGNGDEIYLNDIHDPLSSSATLDIEYSGSLSDDTVYGSDATSNVTQEFWGYSGRDTFYMGNAGGVAYGGSDNDFLYGDIGADILMGGDGSDLIKGGPGDDHLFGDDDDFTTTDGLANNEIHGEEGEDHIYGSDGSERLYGFSSSTAGDDETTDHIYGGGGLDTIHGNGGDDHLYSTDPLGTDEVWPDTILGGDGDDTIQGSSGEDLLEGGSGIDTIYGGGGNDTILGQGEVDYLYGEDGNDTMFGDDGDDVMDGGPDDDIMDGGDNNDDMWGGEGDDRMDGGSGDDTMFGYSGNDRMCGQTGVDTMFGDIFTPTGTATFTYEYGHCDYVNGGNVTANSALTQLTDGGGGVMDVCSNTGTGTTAANCEFFTSQNNDSCLFELGDPENTHEFPMTRSVRPPGDRVAREVSEAPSR